MRHSSLTYRPEIDGLRAIAILGVLGFHAGFGFLGGGFVGVDVFFVISGFLITSIIINEREAGSFSLARFYERRVPGLRQRFCVSATCLAALFMLSKALAV